MKTREQRYAALATRLARPRALALCVLHFLVVVLSTTFAAAGVHTADRSPAVLASTEGQRIVAVDGRDASVERIARPKAREGDRASRPIAFVATLPATSAIAPAPFVELAPSPPVILAFAALRGAAHRARGPPLPL